MGLLTVLKRLLLTFDFMAGDEGSVNREMGRLIRSIQRQGPAWYRPLANRLEPDFAETVARLRESTAGMAAVFRSTIGGDKGSEERAINALIEPLLVSKGLGLKAFSFEAIRAEARGAGGDLLETMDELLKTRLAVFESQEMLRLVTAFRGCLKLASLAGFDYAGLLANFEVKGGQKGRYSSCDAGRAAAAIADLHFLLDGLDLDDRILELIQALIKISGRVEYPGTKATIDFRSLSSIVKKSLDPERLAAVARAAAGDPGLVLREDEEVFDLRAEVRDRIRETFLEQRQALAAVIAEAELERRKKAVFEDRELLVLIGYTKELSTLFAENGLPEFGRINALSITKSFCAFFLAPFIRRAVAAALVGMEFTDMDFRREFAAALDRCNAVATGIEGFEADLVSPASSKVLPIVQTLEGGRLDVLGRSKALRAIDEVEKRADRLIQNAFPGFMDLHDSINRLLADLRARQPELVSNALYINRNKSQMLVDLETSARLLFECVKLLRLFAVDVGEAKRAMVAKPVA